jgi:hypothetical protein
LSKNQNDTHLTKFSPIKNARAGVFYFNSLPLTQRKILSFYSSRISHGG